MAASSNSTRIFLFVFVYCIVYTGKQVHICTILFGDPRNIQRDTKFIVIDILQIKLWAVICLNSHFGGHLGFLKTLNNAIFASFRYSIYRSQGFRINQEQLCGLHFFFFWSSPKKGFFLKTKNKNKNKNKRAYHRRLRGDRPGASTSGK